MIRSAAITFAVMLMNTAVFTSGAEEFQPLCADLESGHHNCWNPVEVFGYEGCHFFGHVSYFDHAPPMKWTGYCGGGMATGLGFLSDDRGNTAEGLLVDGLKERTWTVRLANGGVITENHVKGVFHGTWAFDLPKGRFYAVTYEDGRLHGPWEHRQADDYSEVGRYEAGERQGVWTLSWADDVEAVVPCVDGVVQGEITVAREGRPLGTLIYWKGRHVEGVLAPELIGPPLDP